MVSTTMTIQQSEDEGYDALLGAVRATFEKRATGPLFTTSATGLFEAFLDALPEVRRQHYRCHACRRFLERFGALVTIAEDGRATPAMWDHEAVPTFFSAPVRAIERLVEKATVTGVFLSSDPTWGLPENKSKKEPFVWRHMAVTSPSVYRHPLTNASQAMAEKHEEHAMLCRGLAEFKVETVREAYKLLTTSALYRSEKCIGVAKWLLELHEARAAAPGRRDAITWRAVASAPAGFCHVRSGMIGTLLEDLEAGLPFEDLKRKFDAKMNPLQYQRPQTGPSDGQIAQAEKIVEKLASAGALKRRFARLEDVKALWTPAAAEPAPPAGGVFGHLKTEKKAASLESTAPPITWDKFRREVLPEARSIELLVPSGHASFGALVTAADPEAPPIVQWDREDARNPVTWYLYVNGSPASRWGLTAGRYVRVTTITLQPSMWADDGKHGHQGGGVFFLLEGAVDGEYRTGAGLFPEHLRSEYHPIRKTLEAYAKSAVVDGASEATACGLVLQKSATAWKNTFRVTSRLGVVLYTLDRWD